MEYFRRNTCTFAGIFCWLLLEARLVGWVIRLMDARWADYAGALGGITWLVSYRTNDCALNRTTLGAGEVTGWVGDRLTATRWANYAGARVE
ncbi:hypothetical protein B9T62_37885 [Paenibacillus donghaensis]|uniref:Uncharacterized protein n=1 Tax=Paenibacillus donghaensis TaxID=414771 RepID=A0A2Z2KWT6_9BACL|nr:hypothetical protein B9T62_37885 [Paenibacillus donghaensis]